MNKQVETWFLLKNQNFCLRTSFFLSNNLYNTLAFRLLV